MSEYSQSRVAASGVSVAWSQFDEHSQPRESGLPFALVLLFLAALYSQLALQVPVLGAAGGMNLLGGLAIASVIVSRLLNRAGLELIWPEAYLLLAFVGAAALSSVGALWPRYAMDSTIDLLKYVAVYLLIVHTVDDQRRFRTVLWTLVLGGLFPALGTLNNYLHGNLEEGRADWIGIFGNPNELAYSLIILIPLATYLALT